MMGRLSIIALAISMTVLTGCNRQASDHLGSVPMIDPNAERNAAEAEAAEAELARQETKPKSAAKRKKDARRPASKETKNIYVVQLGAFKVRENAERFQQSLKETGLPVMLKELNHSKNGPMFVVRIEPTPNKTEAQSMLATLREKKAITGHILALPEVE